MSDDLPPIRILVPLDGSEVALEVLGHVEGLAARLDAEITLLRVVPSVADTLAGSHVALDVATAEVAEDERSAMEYLESIAQPMRARGLRVGMLVGEGSPAASILRHLEGMSYIAMTTHSRRGIGRTLFGSVADDVIRNSPIPVFVIHPSSEGHTDGQDG